MPGPIYVTVASAATASGAFALEDTARDHILEVPSLNSAVEVRVQFAPVSGGPSFYSPFRRDGSGAIFTVTSGAGPFYGYLPPPPTPWGRLWVSTNSLTGTTSFAIVPIMGRKR